MLCKSCEIYPLERIVCHCRRCRITAVYHPNPAVFPLLILTISRQGHFANSPALNQFFDRFITKLRGCRIQINYIMTINSQQPGLSSFGQRRRQRADIFLQNNNQKLMRVCCAFEMKFDCTTDEKRLMCSAYLYRCVTYRNIIYDVEIVSSVYTLGRYCVRPITKLSMRRKLRWSPSVYSSFINIQWIRLGLMCNPCNLLYVRCCFGQNDCTFTLSQ